MDDFRAAWVLPGAAGFLAAGFFAAGFLAAGFFAAGFFGFASGFSAAGFASRRFGLGRGLRLGRLRLGLRRRLAGQELTSVTSSLVSSWRWPARRR